jgi:hypothetical protein
LVENPQEKGLLAGLICKWVLEQCIIWTQRMMNVINNDLTELSLQEAVENVTTCED